VYDGDPKFEKISGTKVAYAVNTGAQVLEIGGRYYAVDNGVWFTSSSAKGPWVVADSVPEDEISKIPPSAPVYNTTHVHVYQSTPEVVYVGYTPGYLWSFPYYGVPFYGTGWYYPPYWGSVYYPRAPTWGFHVGYNPWTGWLALVVDGAVPTVPGAVAVVGTAAGTGARSSSTLGISTSATTSTSAIGPRSATGWLEIRTSIVTALKPTCTTRLRIGLETLTALRPSVI
jgi:hypothetical protein